MDKRPIGVCTYPELRLQLMICTYELFTYPRYFHGVHHSRDADSNVLCDVSPRQTSYWPRQRKFRGHIDVFGRLPWSMNGTSRSDAFSSSTAIGRLPKRSKNN